MQQLVDYAVMTVKYKALPTLDAEAFRSRASDANGQVPEHHVSDGGGNPCRHCLDYVPLGEDMLVLAYRPFPDPQPYAELGPIFLCGRACQRHADSTNIPKLFLEWERMLVRGYKSNDRIQYGTGQVVATSDLTEACERLFEDPDVAYIHLRSASNNCYQCRVERA